MPTVVPRISNQQPLNLSRTNIERYQEQVDSLCSGCTHANWQDMYAFVGSGAGRYWYLIMLISCILRAVVYFLQAWPPCTSSINNWGLFIHLTLFWASVGSQSWLRQLHVPPLTMCRSLAICLPGKSQPSPPTKQYHVTCSENLQLWRAAQIFQMSYILHLIYIY